MSIANRLLPLTLAAALLLPAVPAAAGPAGERVRFVSRATDAAELTGWLYRPEGKGPFPAVVGLHGCSGLTTVGGTMLQNYRGWTDVLTAAGYAVLWPESFRPRGFAQVCTVKDSERPIYPRGRVGDAAAAADWLASQPDIDRRGIALMGWSHGGSSVLWALESGRGPSTVEFATAIAFYPGCRTPGQRASRPRLPLTILMGALDDWTPVEPCRDLAQKWGVRLVEYPGAHHVFDAPDLPLRTRTGMAFSKRGDGIVHIGTHPAARAAAIEEVKRILASGK